MVDATISTHLPSPAPTHLPELLAALRRGRGFEHKRDIAQVMAMIQPMLPASATAGAFETSAEANGDDCAVLPLPGALGDQGHLLLAIEGMMPGFVAAQPWFAGYSAVLVNLSDVAAMGGRPLAVVDALWDGNPEHARELLAGMQAACAAYGVPLVGGHTNLRSDSAQLSVAVLGVAKKLISGFGARPGHRLLMAVDLRGRWEGDAPFWNASVGAPPERLQRDLAVLPELAEAGLCRAGKDISMAGALGTLLMLIEGSGCGATVDLQHLPVPPESAGWVGWARGDAQAQAAQLRWLSAFPSYGYLLAVAPEHVAEVQRRFAARDLACADIGACTSGRELRVRWHPDAASIELWDLTREGFIHPEPRHA
jgi:AIR synthase-related protein